MGVVECAVSKELPDFILEPVDNSPLGVLPACSFNKSVKWGLTNMTQRIHVFKAGQEFVAASAN